MVCQRCKKEEAVVHLTVMSPGGEQRRDLCESCYRASEIGKEIASAGWEGAPATKPGWSVDFVDFGKLRYKSEKRGTKKKP